MIDEILKLLNVDALNESQQDQIKQKLNDIIEIKVKEQSDKELVREKEALLESYEVKFDDYKKDITAKFSNFVDSILDEELVVPQNILEFARKGELYSDLIDQIKVRIGIDEGILDKEARELLREARTEILKLQKETNELTKQKLVYEADAKDFAAEIYKIKKCEGLPLKQKAHVLSLMEGVTSVPEIDRKFKLITKSRLFEDGEVDIPLSDGDPEGAAPAESYNCVCPQCGTGSTRGIECSMSECEGCMCSLVDAPEEAEPVTVDTYPGTGVVGDADNPAPIQEKKKVPGKGQHTVKQDVINEEKPTVTPFSAFRDKYVKILRENTY
jgi:hypothetical protein